MADETPTPDSGQGISDASSPAEPDDAVQADSLTAGLFEQYRDRLRLFAARRLRDRAAAEDVVQETLQTILEALRAGRIRESAALAAFAFETARNFCMHRGRSQSREGRALERLAISPPPQAPDALTAVISDERRRAVRAALDRLSDEDRRLLSMTYMDTRDSEDIGRELGLSAGAVRVRRHRALKRLGAELDVTMASDRELDKKTDGEH
jgi:RNA polymerase sigma-70 factor (ECF subfamily)